MSTSEKASSDHKVEDIARIENAGEDSDCGYDPVFVRRTLYVECVFIRIELFFLTPFSRMLDWRMLPLLGGLYAIALIDRTNLGIARIAGMEVDLVSPNHL